MVSRSRDEWVTLAEQAILDLLNTEYAAVKPEIEAKLADRQWVNAPRPIDPHHLTTALQNLTRNGTLAHTPTRTRGGRTIAVYQPSDVTGRARKVASAAARKRLLHTRYLSWATGTGASVNGMSVIGPAGEAVVHASMQAANGYHLAKPAGGDVRTFLGGPVPGGALDNAAFLIRVDRLTGQPAGTFAVPVEVKNVRQWIYPDNKLLHQLLHKAAMLQQRHPTLDFIPVLVCRQAHYLTLTMALELGFYIIPTIRQYIRPIVAAGDDRRAFEEVRDELGYRLEPHDGAVPEMTAHFSTKIPEYGRRTADAWKAVGSTFAGLYKELRRDDLSHKDRQHTVAALAQGVRQLNVGRVRWHREDAQDYVPDDLI